MMELLWKIVIALAAIYLFIIIVSRVQQGLTCLKYAGVWC